MASINLDDHLLHRLNAIAREENKTLEEVVETVLDKFATANALNRLKPETVQETEKDTKNLFLLIAQAAEELGSSSREGNISERSSEIVSWEYGEYLMRRMRGQD